MSRGEELHFAVFEGNIEQIRKLLQEGYNPLQELYDLQFEEEDGISFNCGMSPLSVAAAFGKFDALKYLLDYIFGKLYDHKECCRCIVCQPGPLHMSVLGGWIECADLLISAGWDVNQLDSVFWTPLQIAAYKGQVDVVKHLLKHYAIDKENGYKEAMDLAAEHGNCEICQELLENACGHMRCTLLKSALLVACEHHNDKTVDILLSAGRQENICESVVQECYENIVSDRHRNGRASTVLQIFADKGYVIPHLPKAEVCEKTLLHIPSLQFMAFDCLCSSDSLPVELENYLRKIMLLKTSYICNQCQQTFSGEPCMRKKVAFLSKHNLNESHNVSYNLCLKCQANFE